MTALNDETLRDIAAGKVVMTPEAGRAWARDLIDTRKDSELLKEIRTTLGMGRLMSGEAIIANLQKRNRDREDAREALEQLSTLGTFIGHPGATPAHVVSETVSLIEKFVDAADRTGISRNGRSLSTVAEDVVAKSHRAAPFLKSLIQAGEAVGRPFRGNGSEVLEAIRLERTEMMERMKAAENESEEWRQSSETWQKRALAAEARLSGPGEACPGGILLGAIGSALDAAAGVRPTLPFVALDKETFDEVLSALLGARAALRNGGNISHALDKLTDAACMDRIPYEEIPNFFTRNQEPGGTERLEWSELNSVLAKSVDPDEVSIRTRYGVAVLLRCRTMSLPGVPPFEVAEPVKRGEVQIPEEYLVKP